MEQEQAKRTTETAPVQQDEATAQDAGVAAVAERKAALDEDIDAILDEIEGLLSENPQEFVQAFRQKGGE